MAIPLPSEQMDTEWQSWQSWCKRFEEVVGESVNDLKYGPMIAAVKRWGEELVLLRQEQDSVLAPEVMEEMRKTAPIAL